MRSEKQLSVTAAEVDSVDASPSPMPPVRAIAIVHDRERELYLIRLEFLKVGGGSGWIDVKRSAARRPFDVVAVLRDAGADLTADSEIDRKIVEAAMNSKPTREIIKVSRGGWQQGGRAFVRPHWHVGAANFEWGGAHEKSAHAPTGTLKRWRKGLRKPCGLSSFLSFATGMPFGAVLMELLGEEEGAVFHFHTDSTAGKSLCLRACQSVFGRGGELDLESASITSQRLAEFCCARNSLVAVIDEEGNRQGGGAVKIDRRRTDAFLIAGGRSISRSSSVSATLPDQTWAVLGLTSGEFALDGDASQRSGGQKVRQIDNDLGKHPAGIFDGVGVRRGTAVAEEKGIAMAQKVENTIKQNFDVALRPFVERLLNDPERARVSARTVITEFIRTVDAEGHRYEIRLARKFGIVLAGMILAAEFKIAPWSAKQARRKVERVYKAALQQLRSPSEKAEMVLNVVRAKVTDGSIARLKKGVALKGTDIGFIRKDASGKLVVCVKPELVDGDRGKTAMKDMLHSWASSQLLLRDLARNNDKRQIKVIVDEEATKSYWYVFDYAALMAKSV